MLSRLLLALVLPTAAAEPASLTPEGLAAEAAEDGVRLASVRELLGFLDVCESPRPVGPTEKDRAWDALWKSEKLLSPSTVSLLRELLLDLDRNGPLKEMIGEEAAPRPDAPSPKTRKRLHRRASGLDYAPEAEALLHLIVRYAPLGDAETALETARRERPVITLDPGGMHFASVGLVDSPDEGRPVIRLKPGVALVPAAKVDDGVFQFRTRSGPFYPIPAAHAYYTRLGLDLPELDVFRSTVQARRVEAYYGGEVFVYPDGSGYHRFSNEHLAGVLLHELFHLDSSYRGGGANTHAVELRSFLAQYRLYHNMQERLGSAGFLDVNRQTYRSWMRNPVSLRHFLEAAYPTGRPDNALARAPVLDQIEEARRILALPEPRFRRVSRSLMKRNSKSLGEREKGELEYLRYVGAVKKPVDRAETRAAAPDADAAAFRAELRKSLKRLPVDAELELEARLVDWKWRRDNGLR